MALRVLTLNLWAKGGTWTDRRQLIAEGLRALDPDLMAFQEAVKNDDEDTVAEVVRQAVPIVHQHHGLFGDRNGIAIASRWPVRGVQEVDQQVSPRTSDFSATTMAVEVEAPEPLGVLLFVNHNPSWKPALEWEREQQTVKAARFIEELRADRDMHVLLAGDLDATGRRQAFDSSRPPIPRRHERLLPRHLGLHASRRSRSYLYASQSADDGRQ